MTRTAARDGFETFIDAAIEKTYSEFSVASALQGTRGPGSNVIDRLLKQSDALDRRVVKPELRAFRSDVLSQFEVVLDYATGEEPIERYREELLAADRYAKSMRPTLGAERAAEIRDRLVDRQRRLGDAVEPIVASPEAEFWPAVEQALEEAQAIDLVETHFEFTGPLRDDRDAFVLETTIDAGEILSGFAGLLAGAAPTFSVEYTDEAVRAMRAAEQAIVAETTAEVRSRFDDG